MKYLKLKFSNANLFKKNPKSKDFVIDLIVKKDKLVTNNSKRVDSRTNFKEPITVYQVSNMLHTLVGERPVPSFRPVFYKMGENILNLANNSYINITSPITEKGFIEEFMKLGKSAYNSWSDMPSIQWFKIRKYLGDDFDPFIDMMNVVLGYNVIDKPFMNLRLIYDIYGSKLDSVIEYLLSKKKTPMVHFLKSEVFKTSWITSTISSGLGETISSGIGYVSSLSGEIIVPYNEEFVSKIRKNTTNILDSGYVEIIGVVEEFELGDMRDFKLVSEISTELY